MTTPFSDPRTGQLYFRRGIPEPLRAAFDGKAQYKVSLCTKDPAAAKIGFARENAAFEAKLADARRMLAEGTLAKIKTVLVVGSGTMGSQIGFQCAVHGRDVTMYDVSKDSLDAARARHAGLATLFQQRFGFSANLADEALSRIRYEPDLEIAARGVDLVSESVFESLEAKEKIYNELSRFCSRETIFTTNTLTMLPSQLAGFTDRPHRFLALHFAVPVWDTRLGELMPHAGTDPELVDELLSFAREIGMVPIRLKKEQPGYVVNSVLVPFITSGLDLVIRGVSSAEDVDRAWMITTGAPMGPIGWIDLVGIPTVHHVLTYLADDGDKPEYLPLARYLQEEMLDAGRAGAQSGTGFYSYPDPAFQAQDFLV